MKMEPPTQEIRSSISSNFCESEWSISSPNDTDTEGELTPTSMLQEKMQSLSPACITAEKYHYVDTQSENDAISSTRCSENSSNENINDRCYFENSFPFHIVRYGIPELSKSRGSNRSNCSESSMSSAYSEYIPISQPERVQLRFSTRIDTAEMCHYSPSSVISHLPVELLRCQPTGKKFCCLRSARQYTLKKYARRNKLECTCLDGTSEFSRSHQHLSVCDVKEHNVFDIRALNSFGNWFSNFPKDKQESYRVMLALIGNTPIRCTCKPIRCTCKPFQQDDMDKIEDVFGALSADGVEGNKLIVSNNDSDILQITAHKASPNDGEMENLAVQKAATASNMSQGRNKSAYFAKNSLQSRKKYEAKRTTINRKFSKFSEEKKKPVIENQNCVNNKRKLITKIGYARKQRHYSKINTKVLSNQKAMNTTKKVNPFQGENTTMRKVKPIYPSISLENENGYFESEKHREGSGKLHCAEKDNMSLPGQAEKNVFKDFEDSNVRKCLNSFSPCKIDRENLIIVDDEDSQYKEETHFSVIPKYVHRTERVQSMPFANILPKVNTRGLNKDKERHSNPNTERLSTSNPSLKVSDFQFRQDENCRNQENVHPVAKSRFPVLANGCFPKKGNKGIYTHDVPGKFTSRVPSTAKEDDCTCIGINLPTAAKEAKEDDCTCIGINSRKKTIVGYVPGYGALRMNSNSVKPVNSVYTVNDSDYHSRKNKMYSAKEYRQIRVEPAQAIPRTSSVSTKLPPILFKQAEGIRQGGVSDRRNVVIKKTKNKRGVDILESRAKARQFNTYVEASASARFERQFAADL
ncbi:uncharacterized protein LOC134272763 [Saccostrea cucullata]|uniref:uncharacterized protein LOC134272763 n=1 Tax=Saccostrea cuccullata TaxID=36930 RepID=UPI002ED44993